MACRLQAAGAEATLASDAGLPCLIMLRPNFVRPAIEHGPINGLLHLLPAPTLTEQVMRVCPRRDPLESEASAAAVHLLVELKHQVDVQFALGVGLKRGAPMLDLPRRSMLVDKCNKPVPLCEVAEAIVSQHRRWGIDPGHGINSTPGLVALPAARCGFPQLPSGRNQQVMGSDPKLVNQQVAEATRKERRGRILKT